MKAHEVNHRRYSVSGSFAGYPVHRAEGRTRLLRDALSGLCAGIVLIWPAGSAASPGCYDRDQCRGARDSYLKEKPLSFRSTSRRISIKIPPKRSLFVLRRDDPVLKDRA